MDKPDTLIALLREEDRLMRQLLERCPPEDRETRGKGGTLSLKETLGHLAFWDTFAIQFFEARLAGADPHETPSEFERRSREELERLRELSFDQAHERYLRATGGLIAFLQAHWHELSPKQRQDFHVPLKHRRHHRLLLLRALGGDEDGPGSRARAARG